MGWLDGYFRVVCCVVFGHGVDVFDLCFLPLCIVVCSICRGIGSGGWVEILGMFMLFCSSVELCLNLL